MKSFVKNKNILETKKYLAKNPDRKKINADYDPFMSLDNFLLNNKKKLKIVLLLHSKCLSL